MLLFFLRAHVHSCMHVRSLMHACSVGCVLNLEVNFEFSSHLALVLVPHWVEDGRLNNIYTNSFHAYCYE